MTRTTIYISGCIVLGLMSLTGCGNTSEKTASPGVEANTVAVRAMNHPKDKYWTKNLDTTQQAKEAQVMSLLMLVVSNPDGLTEYLSAKGDPNSFSANDPLLKQLYAGDPKHEMYAAVRTYLLAHKQDYVDLGVAFRKQFLPLSKSALGISLAVGGDNDPYPGDICPSPASVCDASNGAGLPCTVQ